MTVTAGGAVAVPQTQWHRCGVGRGQWPSSALDRLPEDHLNTVRSCLLGDLGHVYRSDPLWQHLAV